MNGGVIPGTPIVVDFWKIRECGTGKLFFLTHLHGDHVVGLTSSWNRPIYCSPMTAKLLDRRYHINTSLIKVLEENESHVLNSGDGQYITVTVIDANHCPGAVMFLFEGDFGKILYTGDFRFCAKTTNSSLLSEHLGSIDSLYLDNTYCSPSCDFLTQEEATQSILTIIRRFPKHNIVFGMRNLGKEQLLVNIALELKEWIAVPGRIIEVANLLDMPNVFVLQDDAPNCRLRVVPFQSVNVKQLSLWNEENPTIGILPSALYTGMDGMRPTFFESSHRFIVPYSDHSSYSELLNFVAFIRPKRIVPIVKANAKGPCQLNLTERANMSCFDHLLRSSPIRQHKRRKLYDPFSARVELFNDTEAVLDDDSEWDKPVDKKSRRVMKRKPRAKTVKGVSFTDSPRKPHGKEHIESASSTPPIGSTPSVGPTPDNNEKPLEKNSQMNKTGSVIQSDKEVMCEIYLICDDDSPSEIRPVDEMNSTAETVQPMAENLSDLEKLINSPECPDLNLIDLEKLINSPECPDFKKVEMEKNGIIGDACDVESNHKQKDISISANPKSKTNLIVTEANTFINESPSKSTKESPERAHDEEIVLSDTDDPSISYTQQYNVNRTELYFPSVKKVISASEQRRSLYNSLKKWFHISHDVDDVFD